MKIKFNIPRTSIPDCSKLLWVVTMRQLKGKPKENSKEKKERKKEFRDTREQVCSLSQNFSNISSVKNDSRFFQKSLNLSEFDFVWELS